MKRLLLLAGLLIATPALAAPDFPVRSGDSPIIDAANIIPDDREAALVQRLREIEGKAKNPIVILTVPSLNGYAISDYGYQAGRHYGVGNRDKDNGVLLTIAPNDRKVRIDIGYGLEPMFTDGESGAITDAMVTRYFKAGDFPGGIEYGVDEIAKQITPLTPEQIELQQREEQARRERAAAFWAKVGDFFMTLLAIIAGIFATLGVVWVARIPARRRARERAEQEEAARQKAEAARQAERDRLAAERREADRKAREERAAQEAEQARIEAEARKNMLAALTPAKRKAFLAEEERQRRLKAEEQKKIQAAADEIRRRREVEEARRLAAQRERERRERREREDREEEERRARRRREENSSWGSSSSSSWDSSSSSSSSSDSFGGGDFGGGGSDSSW